MNGKFTVTIEELFQMTTYDNYIAFPSRVFLCDERRVLKALYFDWVNIVYGKSVTTQILVKKNQYIYPLDMHEFLISKSTFIRLILILMVKERLGHHNNMGSCFLTPELLNYLKNQS